MSERPLLVHPHSSISHASSLLSAWLRRLVDLFAPAQPTDHHFMVVRPQDLLVLYLGLHNFRIEAGSPPKLRRASQQSPSVITVTLYPQHIAEEAFFEASPGFEYSASIADDSLLAPLYQLTAVPSDTDLKDLPKELARQCGLSIPQHCRGQGRPQPDQWRIWLDGQPGYTLTKVIAHNQPWLKVEPDPGSLSDPPVQARLSRPSYLVFDASTLDTLDFTLPSLLKALAEARSAPPTGLACLVPRLAPAAEPDSEADVDPLNPPPLTEPTELMTQIEAPFRLVISPTRSGRWLHAYQPVVSPAGWTELWHMRLAEPSDDGVIRDNRAKIRAIWTREPSFDPSATQAPEHKNDPFRASLDAADRFNLVHLTSNFQLTSTNPDAPLVTAAVHADRLMLSALGAWLDLRGDWKVRELDLQNEVANGLSVSEWRHRATMARDHYVRVVYEGFLFPFGHRVALVKITERKFHNDKPGNSAYLRQRMFLVVREPIKSYGAPGLMAPDPLRSNTNVPVERYLPFKTVRITTRVTPDLDPPGPDLTMPDASQSKFWPSVGGKLFPFHLQATDQDSRPIEFDAPLIFIALEVANDLDEIGAIANQYNQGQDPLWESRRTRSLAGQALALAPSAPGAAGSTIFETQNMTLGVLLPTTAQDLINQHQPGFFPAMLKAEVFIPDFKYLAGKTDLAWLRYALIYLNQGIANQIEAFAELIDDQYQPKTAQLEFAGQAHRSGALLTPNMRVSGLSRTLGPAVGGNIDALDGGSYSALSLFENMAPKLLGQFDLIQLIPPPPDTSQPTVATERVDGTTAYTVTWNDVPLQSLAPFDNKGGAARLTLKVETFVPAGGQEPQTSVRAKLTGFALAFGFLRVNFSELGFSSAAGRKPDVVAMLDGIEFLNELGFVNKLKDLIPLNGFSDPPALAVTDEGLTAGYSLALPNVGMGVFSLEHMVLAAELALPFTETPPGIRFNFARRESPFTLSVGPFGGGGFFGLEATAAGVEVLEVSLEFGAYISVNFGVASGGVHALGGVYIKLNEYGHDKLAGYFRMGGEVDVLGLISASIELYMALAYEASKAVGRASITVEIEILFFSTSVSISCERKFAGSAGDPSFEDVMGPYCVHGPTGQVLYRDSTGQIFYLDLLEEDEAYRFDPVTGAYVPQPAHTFTEPVPYRPNSEPAPADAKNVYPWGDYCDAFAG